MNEKPRLIIGVLLITLFLSGLACRFSFSADENKANPETIPLEDTATQELSPTKTAVSTATEIVPNFLNQWAVSAVDRKASPNSAFAVGEPDAEGCELSPPDSSWQYLSEFDDPEPDTIPAEYLQLFYADPVIPNQVNIHLAYQHLAIVRVSLIDLSGEPHTIYEDAPTILEECPFILSVEEIAINDPVYAIRIDLDTLAPEEESQITAIDAVELIGSLLSTSIPTPNPTPYLTLSSLGFNASEVQEGFFYFTITDRNTGETLTTTECDIFSHNLTDTDRNIRLFSCEDETEIWLYLPITLEPGSVPLNSFPNSPTAKLLYQGTYIPAMEGEVWIDLVSDATITGVLEFSGFDPNNNVDFYGITAVFNQIPFKEEVPSQPGEMIIQWAEDVRVSSELSTEYEATQVLGPSDTWENCATASTAWRPAPSNRQEWIEFYFQRPVQPTSLNILFTGSPESVVAVNLLSDTDYTPLDLTISRVLEGCPTALTFDPINEINQPMIGVQIIFASTDTPTPLGVDAVQMIGVILE